MVCLLTCVQGEEWATIEALHMASYSTARLGGRSLATGFKARDLRYWAAVYHYAPRACSCSCSFHFPGLAATNPFMCLPRRSFLFYHQPPLLSLRIPR